MNEDAVIAETLAAVPPDLFDLVVVADNGSTDRTAETSRAAGAMVVSEPERGYGAACLRAIAALPPHIDAVVFMQADLSEDPNEARLLVAPLREGRADLVLGSRTLGRAEAGALLPHQEFGNRIAAFLLKALYGHSYSDLGPFRAIRVDTLRALGMTDRNYGWTVEMQALALERKIRVMEIPVTYRVRRAGVNKVSGNWKASLKAGWKIVWTIFRVSLQSRR